MKKLYTRFFHIPKHEKIGEKVMLVRVATTIATIVVCLIAMSLTAYAYFSCDITSGSNSIKAAKFDAQITVTDENDHPVEPSSKHGKKTSFTFSVPGTYTVTLEKGNSSAQTGFCVVYVGEDTYHTQQIGVDVLANDQNRESVAFTLQMNEIQTITIESHWGTSSHYDYDSSADNDFYIVESEPLKVIVVGTATDSGTDTEEVTTTTTTTTETTTTIPETSVTQTTGTTKTTQTTNTIETTSTETTGTKTTTPPETTGTSEPTNTTEPSTSTTEPTTTQPTETTSTETTGTETTEQPQPTTETTEPTGAPTTEANE